MVQCILVSMVKMYADLIKKLKNFSLNLNVSSVWLYNQKANINI